MTATHIPGWAFKPNETELRDASYARLDELKSSGRRLTVTGKTTGYGRAVYRGIADADLSDRDIALLCDSHPCFGGSVERNSDGTFVAAIYTD